MKKIVSIALLIILWCWFSGSKRALEAHFIWSNGDIYVDNTCGEKPYDKGMILETVSGIYSNYNKNKTYSSIEVGHPYNNAIFPRDIASPLFIWKDNSPESDIWLIHIYFEMKKFSIYILSSKTEWVPDRKVWEIIKENSAAINARITILGANLNKDFHVKSRKTINISTSIHKVRAPIMYQQMPVPISEGAKRIKEFRWLLGDISSYNEPNVILKNLPVCGMCHHFSRDGKMFGMDIDINGDKGAYALSQVKKDIVLAKDNFISWTDFQNDGNITLGLFSKISPDGRHVICTIKEKRVFIVIDDPEFSELFFPFEGVLACYSIPKNRFFILPGADDPAYVHIGPDWSPDGKYIIFSRARADRKFLKLMSERGSLIADKNVRIDELNKKHQLRYDLYRIPFNNGKGGTPEPVKGASFNSKSNYWPRYSPGGKWIVYTQSENALMNQPGSRLFIIPAEGGTARMMQCSREVHNSWHSWSPDGRWLVFSSKVNTPLTELFLAHVDENGKDAPPVLLHRFSSKTLASVLPEFANIRPDAIKKITVEDVSKSRK